MRNFLVTLCWALLVVAFGRILPPVRTARRLFARSVLPAALGGAAAAIGETVARRRRGVGGDGNGNDADADGEEEESGEENERAPLLPSTAALEEGEKRARRRRRRDDLVRAYASLASGGMASLTSFEPRLSCRNPFECTWPILEDLDNAVARLVAYALAGELHEKYGEEEDTEEDRVRYENDLALLEKCAEALKDDDEEGLLIIAAESSPGSTTKEAEEGDAEKGDGSGSSSPRCRSFFGRMLTSMAERVRYCTLAWLDAMHRPECSGAKDGAFQSYVPWVVGVVAVLGRMFVALTLPFRPGRWDITTLLLAAKFSLGATILVIMEVYWAEYRGFAVGRAEPVAVDPEGTGVTVKIADTPNLYSGWNLIAYVLATSSTTEGTVKKGTLRALGTTAGGFSAWIAIVVCSGSYDQDVPVNVYGIVAWLTVTTGVAAHLFIPGGPMAMVGVNADNGLYGVYYVLTQALCALEVTLGLEKRDVIVANRIIATVSGVVLAMIIAVIPPRVMGADPSKQCELVELCRSAFEDGASLLMEGGAEGISERIEGAKASFQAKAEQKKKDVQFLLKDADKLRELCFFKVDPRLQKELDAISVTGAYVYYWLAFASHVAKDDTVTLSDAEKERFKGEVKALLDRLGGGASGTDGVETATPPDDSSMTAIEGQEAHVLLAMGHFICSKLEHHEETLNSMESSSV